MINFEIKFSTLHYETEKRMAVGIEFGVSDDTLAGIVYLVSKCRNVIINDDDFVDLVYWGKDMRGEYRQLNRFNHIKWGDLVKEVN